MIESQILFTLIEIMNVYMSNCTLTYRWVAMSQSCQSQLPGRLLDVFKGTSLQRGVVLKWFCLPVAVGTPLSEVHALYRVPF